MLQNFNLTGEVLSIDEQSESLVRILIENQHREFKTKDQATALVLKKSNFTVDLTGSRAAQAATEISVGNLVSVTAQFISTEKNAETPGYGNPWLTEDQNEGFYWLDASRMNFLAEKADPKREDQYDLTLAGHLGRDPEMKYSANSVAFTNINLGTARSWYNPETEKWEKNTAWFRLVAFRGTAEFLNANLVKGNPLLVTAVLEVDDETGGPKTWESEKSGTGVSYNARIERAVPLLPKKQPVTPAMEEGYRSADEEEIPF